MSTSHDYETEVARNGDSTAGEPTGEEVTQADEAWPIPREYRIDAAPEQPTEVGPPVAGGEMPGAPPRRRLPVSGDLAAGLALVLALALGAGAWLAVRSDGSGSPARLGAVTVAQAVPAQKKPAAAKPARPKRIAAPAVSGKTLEEARTALERAGLTVQVRTAPSSKPGGVVLRQTPSAGTDVPPGSSVVIVVSSGPRPVVVPNVVGAEARFAARRLRDEGLRVAIERVRANDAAGTVVSESPGAGSRVPRGATVRLLVAKRAPRAPVPTLALPDVVGLQVGQARARLGTLGLRVRVIQTRSDRPQGEVVSQSPDAGTRVRKGDRVEVGVSSGPALVTVPDVTGLDEDSARVQLEQAGFAVSVVNAATSDPSQDGIVTDESPVSGGQARQGATVTITVARYSG